MASSPAWHVDAADRVIGMVRAPFGRESRTVSGAEAIRAHADWGNAAGMPSHVLLRRSVVQEVGVFEPEFAPASDVHLWLKVLARHDLAWVPEPRCCIRLHDEHDHGYEYAADESVFRLWKDMAAREPAAVDDRMLRRALDRRGSSPPSLRRRSSIPRRPPGRPPACRCSTAPRAAAIGAAALRAWRATTRVRPRPARPSATNGSPRGIRPGPPSRPATARAPRRRWLAR